MIHSIKFPVLAHPNADDPLDERLDAAHKLRAGGFLPLSGSWNEVEDVRRQGHVSLRASSVLQITARVACGMN